MKQRFSDNIVIRNRQAGFQYELLDKYVAGIVLTGTEIKSIREGRANITDGYCYFHRGELFIRGMTISPYAEGTHYNHDPQRERKLLLKRSELRKLEAKLEKGLTLVPLRLFINERGYAKLEIALARGKNLHDKREAIKERDVQRELSRIKW
jgi:SsrA-binding protein